jgi:hypothetical protein
VLLMLPPQVGTKLRVFGAKLSSSAMPCHPMAASSSGAMLQLPFNGTSPVPWDAQLGGQHPSLPVMRPLGLVAAGGGPVLRTLVVVQVRQQLQH